MKLSVTASDEKNLKVLELAKQRFEEKYSGAAIAIEPLPKEILSRRVREGNPPDLIEWDGGDNLGAMLDDGMVMDLQSLITEGDFDLSDFYPSVIQAASNSGRLGAIPVMAEMPGVFYNKALLDQAGIAYPNEGWTWDEFVKKARKLNIYDADGEVIRYGAYVVPRLFPVEPLVWSAGGAFLSEDGTKATGYLDSAATVEAIRRYIEMFYPLEVSPFLDVGRDSWISCFIHNRMAMYYDANWTIKPMRPEHREQFGVVMPPRMGDAPFRNLFQACGYSISSQTADVKLAWAFLQELASPQTESGREWAKYNLAVSRTAAEAGGQLADPLYRPFHESMADARQSAFDISHMRLWKVWNNDVFQEWIPRGGRVNVEERLHRIAKEFDEGR